jgi:hypothetical protein
VRVAPGATRTLTLRLTHSGSESIRVEPEIRSFVPAGAGKNTGSVRLLESNEFPHISFADESVSDGIFLDSGDTAEVELRIDPPAEAIGEYPTTVLFSARSAQAPQIGVAATIGANIITTVQSYEDDRADINISEIDAPRFVDSLSGLSFGITARNDGSNASFASGSATVRDFRGATVGEYPFAADMILSNYSRSLRTQSDYNRATPLSLLQGENPTAVSGDEPDLTSRFRVPALLLFGPYEIEAQIKPNSQSEQFVTARQRVIAAPFSLITLAVLGVIIWFGWRYVQEL